MLTIGVLIPYFNHSIFLREALLSLVAQSRLPDIVLLVDDGSKKTEAGAAEELCAQYGVIYERHKVNWGPAAAKNTGMRILLSHSPPADIVICLDADDMIAPGYIAMMENALDEHPEALVAYPDVQMIGFEQRVMKAPTWYHPSNLLMRPFIINGAAFRASMWEDIYRYNGQGWDTNSDRWGWEDYLFWLEGLIGVAKGNIGAAVHAGPNKFWYLYRRFNRPDRSDGNEEILWAYMAHKMRETYGVTLPPMPREWLVR